MKIEEKFLEQAGRLVSNGSPKTPTYSASIDDESKGYVIEITFGGETTVEQRAATLQVMNHASNQLRPFFAKPVKEVGE